MGKDSDSPIPSSRFSMASLNMTSICFSSANDC
jgi:hypothetical protein